jgi:small subunit ribosomal protein S21
MVLIKNKKKNLQYQKYFYIFVIYLYIMIIIDVTKEKSIESALRAYKQKVQKTKQIQKLRSRQEFTKPSVVKREEKLKAIYVQQIKNGLN